MTTAKSKQPHFSLFICLLATAFVSTTLSLFLVIVCGNQFLKSAIFAEQNFRSANLFASIVARQEKNTNDIIAFVKRNVKNIATDKKFDLNEMLKFSNKLVRGNENINLVAIAYTNTTPSKNLDKDFQIAGSCWVGDRYINFINPIEWKDRLKVNWFRDCYEKGAPFWNTIERDPLSGCLLLTYSYPYINSNNEVQAVLMIGSSLQDYGLSLLKTNFRTHFGYSFISSRAGSLFLHLPNGSWHEFIQKNSQFENRDSNPEKLDNLEVLTKNAEHFSQELKRNFAKQKSGEFVLNNVFGEKKMHVFYNHFPLSDGITGIMISEKRGFNAVYLANKKSFYYFLLLFTIIVPSSLFAAKYLSNNFRELTRTAKRIAAGNFETPLPNSPRCKEFAQLILAFEDLRTDLKTHIAEITHSEAEMEAIISQLKIAHDVQQGMMPDDFKQLRPFGVDLYAKVQNAENLGGTLYDFELLDNIPAPDRNSRNTPGQSSGLQKQSDEKSINSKGLQCKSVYFSIGDVSANNALASIVMAQIQAFLWASISVWKDPAKVLLLANKHLLEMSNTGLSASILCGIFTPATGDITFACAGPVLACIIDECDEIACVSCEIGAPLLAEEEPVYENCSLNITQGSKFFTCVGNLPLQNNLRMKSFELDQFFNSIQIIMNEQKEEQIKRNLQCPNNEAGSNANIKSFVSGLTKKIEDCSNKENGQTNVTVLAFERMKGSDS